MFQAIRYWCLLLRVEHAAASCEAQTRLIQQSAADLAESELHLLELQRELALAETAFLMRRHS